jgi:hypothetical protein
MVGLMAAPTIPGLTASQLALLRKVATYYVKHKMMINEYKGAKDRAVERYRLVGFIPARAKMYEAAWNRMPANYEAKISDIETRLAAWVIKYCAKMFGVTITHDTALSFVKSIIAGLKPIE